MNSSITTLIALGAFTIFLVMPIGFVSAEKMQCKDEHGVQEWGDKDHDDNSPSTNDFHKAAYSKSLCDLAKGIDHENYANHEAVNWKKFVNSPAFENASEEQQDCLKKAHHDGNGMDGAGGYEILYCAIDNDNS